MTKLSKDKDEQIIKLSKDKDEQITKLTKDKDEQIIKLTKDKEEQFTKLTKDKDEQFTKLSKEMEQLKKENALLKQGKGQQTITEQLQEIKKQAVPKKPNEKQAGPKSQACIMF